ncbi:MAG TPA: GntR family transcriptional regulator [Novosphingobium sp.]|nr:GntR family transcriptional regulator [Novosphingobium sp.]
MVLLNSPITPFSLVDQTFERIADAIVMGELKPGERIREAYLARTLGVSRGVLREAMQRLEGRKLVLRTSNIGVHVVQLSRQDLFELSSMREALEGMAARLCALHMSEEDIAGLRQHLAEHEDHSDLKQGDGYFQAVADDLHYRIARGSGNERLQTALCDELFYQLRLYRYRSSAMPGRAQEALREHHAIVDAIARRDGDAAETAMRTHLTNSRAHQTFDIEASND